MDLPVLFEECDRVLKPGGVLAVANYSLCNLRVDGQSERENREISDIVKAVSNGVARGGQGVCGSAPHPGAALPQECCWGSAPRPPWAPPQTPLGAPAQDPLLNGFGAEHQRGLVQGGGGSCMLMEPRVLWN